MSCIVGLHLDRFACHQAVAFGFPVTYLLQLPVLVSKQLAVRYSMERYA